MRLLLAVAAAKSWHIHQLDVNDAFLHGFINEGLYLQPPEEYYKALPGQVCKLKRFLYGLKQASRQWNIKFTCKLHQYGFIQSPHDPCLFTLSKGAIFLALLVYVDDILLVGSSLDDLVLVKEFLHSQFTIKDLGQAHYFLGVELARSDTGLYLNQRKYVLDLLSDSGLTDCKLATTPLPRDAMFDLDSPLLHDADQFRRLVGQLLYLGFTRPDLSHAAQQLSQFVQAPTDAHWSLALHVLRYLKGYPSKGLFFPVQPTLSITGFCDADWVYCPLSLRSLTSYCVFRGSALIS
ncbi:hypothetical protein Sjap_017529 [Stephania japonica]|uniref:Reverse transcriptase Ty1/copia-type domain-containing protein n=1 Tax=Stephania japonica TaxID=461633 RepID=A0AAP0I6B7_9MAGN